MVFQGGVIFVTYYILPEKGKVWTQENLCDEGENY